MRKKVFGLEQVLNFRNEVEKIRKVEFAEARHQYEQASDRLRREEEKMDSLNMEFMDRQLAGICALELRMYADFFRKKEVDIKAQKMALTSLDKEVSEKREMLLDASRDKKVLEELKKKKIKAFNLDLAEKERNFLDELALRKGGHSTK